MTAIGEYLKLIPKALPNTIEIVKAVSNCVQMKYGTLPEKEKEEIIRRRLICHTCPFMSKNTASEYKELVGKEYITNRTDEHCSFCGCGIQTRTAALNSTCGISSWNSSHENQLSLKWDKFKNDG